MKTIHLPLLIVAASAFTLLPACEKDTPAERAGDKIEDATDDAGDAVEKMGDKIEEKTDE